MENLKEQHHESLEQAEIQRATVISTKHKLTLDLLMDDQLEAEVAIISYCQQQKFCEETAALSSERGTVSRIQFGRIMSCKLEED